jgi:hypothetical protein
LQGIFNFLKIKFYFYSRDKAIFARIEVAALLFKTALKGIK